MVLHSHGENTVESFSIFGDRVDKTGCIIGIILQFLDGKPALLIYQAARRLIFSHCKLAK